MKKKVMFLLMFVLMACLTSCQVNWFDKQYTVPWWLVVIPSVIIVVVALVLTGKHITSQQYVCPECGEKFYPNFWKAMFSVHMNDNRVLKCPYCGRKGFCPPVRDND